MLIEGEADIGIATEALAGYDRAGRACRATAGPTSVIVPPTTRSRRRAAPLTLARPGAAIRSSPTTPGYTGRSPHRRGLRARRASRPTWR